VSSGISTLLLLNHYPQSQHLTQAFVILPHRRLRRRRQSHKLIVEQSGNGIATENALPEFGE
jgi:hypothetical protein